MADTVNRRLNHGMSTSELKISYRAALHQARREGARVTARATVSQAAARSASSPPPGPCTSGRLLHITLAGDFPRHRHVGNAGSALVTGEQLTVDATTGRVCESQYLSGPVLTDPMSVLLFSG